MEVKTIDQSAEKFRTLASKFDQKTFKKLNETMTWGEYLNKVYNRPQLAYSAYQRLYNMIMLPGVEKFEKYRRTVTHYKFFDQEPDPIMGLEDTLESLVKHIKGAAGWHGTERRILLLHGPVGSSKSTICRRLKRGMEEYSRTDDGAIYSYNWKNIKEFDIKDESPCPMNDDPLKLIPVEMRAEFIGQLNARLEDTVPDTDRHMVHNIRVTGELNPHCKYFMGKLLKHYNGDLSKVLENHIEVKRILLSESERCGIGTFQPKDPKNQDATELTGDINYMKLGHYGVDSDPRAFSFDGEFEIANRGMLEMIEILKLEKEFLYDLLGVCQERQFKPKKFPQIDVDLVIIGHTNSPEFIKLTGDPTMEALRDRTVRIDVPYLLEHKHELKVLEHDYGKHRVKTHVAPHTLEIASLWAILTRLNDDKDNKLQPVEKAKLYDGRVLPGWTEDMVKELRQKTKNQSEGLKRGISARFVQNAISNALVSNPGYVNPFMVMSEIKEKLKFLMINSEDDRQFYDGCVDAAKKELDEILKNEVQRALVADDSAIERLFANYIDNVVAHCEKAKIKNPYTGQEVDPDERLMRSIEEKADIPEQMADDFRRQMAEFIGRQSIKKKEVRWDSNAKLAKALEAKLFEDTKDTIKIAKLSQGASVVDKATQEKIDAIKSRMIKNYGYNEESAADVLNYVSSIFTRGDLVNEE
jgi:serine protein kinase